MNDRPVAGTPQHSDASDLSRYLVHLTRSEDDLNSILASGKIEARGAFGIGKCYPVALNKQRSVCFTEMPLSELRRMTADRPWGLVFDKERMRAKFGAQPVWYVSEPSAQMIALKAQMDKASPDASDPVWDVSPFVESVRSRASKYPNDWRWEREWRIRGDVEFDINDVEFVILNEAGVSQFSRFLAVGVPWMSPDGGPVRWSGGPTPNWEVRVEEMLERFHGTFETPESAALPWDSEEGEYVQVVPIVETDEAVSEVFGQMNDELLNAIVGALDQTSFHWCRTFDVNHAHE